MASRKRDAAWMYCREVVEGNRRKVKCNYCSKVIGSITRLKQHLAIVGTDVKACPDVSSEVSEEMRNSLVQLEQKAVLRAHNHDEVFPEQQHWPPGNVAVANDYSVYLGSQVPIAFQAQPAQVPYPSPTVTPSRFCLMYQQQHMGLERQPLPLLSMFDAGTSSPIQDHQSTYSAAANGEELPLAHGSDIILELQLGTKPRSPDYERNQY